MITSSTGGQPTQSSSSIPESGRIGIGRRGRVRTRTERESESQSESGLLRSSSYRSRSRRRQSNANDNANVNINSSEDGAHHTEATMMEMDESVSKETTEPVVCRAVGMQSGAAHQIDHATAAAAAPISASAMDVAAAASRPPMVPPPPFSFSLHLSTCTDSPSPSIHEHSTSSCSGPVAPSFTAPSARLSPFLLSRLSRLEGPDITHEPGRSAHSVPASASTSAPASASASSPSLAFGIPSQLVPPRIVAHAARFSLAHSHSHVHSHSHSPPPPSLSPTPPLPTPPPAHFLSLRSRDQALDAATNAAFEHEHGHVHGHEHSNGNGHATNHHGVAWRPLFVHRLSPAPPHPPTSQLVDHANALSDARNREESDRMAGLNVHAIASGIAASQPDNVVRASSPRQTRSRAAKRKREVEEQAIKHDLTKARKQRSGAAASTAAAWANADASSDVATASPVPPPPPSPAAHLLIHGLDGSCVPLRLSHANDEWSMPVGKLITRWYAPRVGLSDMQAKGLSCVVQGHAVSPYATVAELIKRHHLDKVAQLESEDASMSISSDIPSLHLHILGRPWPHPYVAQVESCYRMLMRRAATGEQLYTHDVATLAEALRRLLGVATTDLHTLVHYMACCLRIMASHHWPLVYVGVSGVQQALQRMATETLRMVMDGALDEGSEQDGWECRTDMRLFMRILQQEHTIECGLMDPIARHDRATGFIPSDEHTSHANKSIESTPTKTLPSRSSHPRFGAFDPKLTFAHLSSLPLPSAKRRVLDGSAEPLVVSDTTTSAAGTAVSVSGSIEDAPIGVLLTAGHEKSDSNSSSSKDIVLSLDGEKTHSPCKVEMIDVTAPTATIERERIQAVVEKFTPLIAHNMATCLQLLAHCCLLLLRRAREPAHLVESCSGNMSECSDSSRKNGGVAKHTLLMCVFDWLRTHLLFSDVDHKRLNVAATLISHTNRMQLLDLILRCIHTLPAHFLSIHLMRNLGDILKVICSFPVSSPLLSSTRMLPSFCSSRVLALATRFRPFRCPVLNPSSEPLLAEHQRALEEASTKVWGDKGMASLDQPLEIINPTPTVEHVHLPECKEKPLNNVAYRHILRRLFYFTFSRHEFSKEGKQGFLSAIVCIQQLCGSPMFSFTESLLHDTFTDLLKDGLVPLVAMMRRSLSTADLPTLRIMENPDEGDNGAKTQAQSTSLTTAISDADWMEDETKENKPTHPSHSTQDDEDDEKESSSPSVDDVLAWRAELPMLERLTPPRSTTSDPSSIVQNCSSCFNRLLGNLTRLLTCPPRGVMRADTMMRDKKRVKLWRLASYLSAWKKAYEEMNKDGQSSTKDRDTGMEVDETNKLQASLHGKAGPSIGAQHSGPGPSPKPRPLTLWKAHCFDTDVSRLSTLINTPTLTPRTPVLGAWLDYTADPTASPSDSASDTAPPCALVQLLLDIHKELGSMLAALALHIRLELKLHENGTFIIGRTRLRSMQAATVRMLPSLLSTFLQLHLHLAVHGSHFFPGIDAALYAIRDLFEEHAPLLNVMAAHDSAITAAPGSHLNFLTHPHWFMRPSPSKLPPAAPVLQRSSSSLARSPTTPPHLLSFAVRQQHLNRILPALGNSGARAPHSISVRRSHILQDAFAALRHVPPATLVHQGLSVHFKEEAGTGPGVMREFTHLVLKALFDPSYALWQPLACDPCSLVPNSMSSVNPDHLLFFNFTGRMVALAVMARMKVEYCVASACLQYCLGASLDWRRHLLAFDPSMHAQFHRMLNEPGAEALGLTFSATVMGKDLQQEDRELIPGGADIAVTDANKHEYVQKYVEMRLIGSVKEQLDAFKKGLTDLLPVRELQFLNELELQLFLCGTPKIDPDDWRRHTSYRGFNPTSPIIQWFWEIVKGLNDVERCNLLFFATSLSRVPASGFGELVRSSSAGSFRIAQQHVSGNVDQAFPVSHTCFMELTLPAYSSKEVLAEKIKAICADRSKVEGFGFM